MDFRFKDRSEAGNCLANKLLNYANRSDVIVLALPRGGVPVAYEVASLLKAPMDVFVVRKLGVPGHEELAMGAIASGGVCFFNEHVIQSLGIPQSVINEVVRKERQELLRREQTYRKSDLPMELRGHVVILVDDGLATGASMRAAVRAVHEHDVAQIVVAVPVASLDTCRKIGTEVDDIVCLETPEPFFAVGEWYEDFSQTTDHEVRELLEKATKFQQRIPVHC